MQIKIKINTVKTNYEHFFSKYKILKPCDYYCKKNYFSLFVVVFDKCNFFFHRMGEIFKR